MTNSIGQNAPAQQAPVADAKKANGSKKINTKNVKKNDCDLLKKVDDRRSLIGAIPGAIPGVGIVVGIRRAYKAYKLNHTTKETKIDSKEANKRYAVAALEIFGLGFVHALVNLVKSIQESFKKDKDGKADKKPVDDKKAAPQQADNKEAPQQADNKEAVKGEKTSQNVETKVEETPKDELKASPKTSEIDHDIPKMDKPADDEASVAVPSEAAAPVADAPVADAPAVVPPPAPPSKDKDDVKVEPQASIQTTAA